MKYKVYVRYDYTREILVEAENKDTAEDIAIQAAIDHPVDIAAECEPYVDYTETVENYGACRRGRCDM